MKNNYYHFNCIGWQFREWSAPSSCDNFLKSLGYPLIQYTRHSKTVYTYKKRFQS